MGKYLADHFLVLVKRNAGLGGIFQFFEFGNRVGNIAQQHVGHIAAHALAYHDTHHNKVLQIVRQGVGRHHPAALLQLVLQVIKGPFGLLGIFRFHIPDKERIDYIFTVHFERGHLVELVMQVFGNVHAVLLNFLVPLESQTDKLVILTQNLRGGT